MSDAAIAPERPWAAGPLGIAVMLTGAMFSGLIFVAVGPVLPMLASHFGGGNQGAALAQWTMTVPSVGLVFGGLFGGWIFDRFGPRQVLPPAFVAYGIAGAGGAWFSEPALLLASRLVIGFCACVISLGTTVMIAEAFHESRRAKMLGYKNAIAAAVGIGGAMVSGAVAEAFGWRAAFAVYGVALLFVLPAIVSTRSFPAPLRETDSAQAGYWRDIGRSWFLYAAIIAFAILVMAPMTQVPFLLHEMDVRSPKQLALVLGCASFGSACGGFLFGHVIARLGMIGTFVAMMAVWAASMLMLGTAASASHAALGCLASGIASGMFVVYMANALVVRVAPRNRGRAVGFLYVSLFAGDFVTPMVLVPMAEAVGRHTSFLLLALPCALAILVVLAAALVRREAPAAGTAAG